MMLQSKPPNPLVVRAMPRELAERVMEQHLAFARLPITGPDQYGCFPGSPLVTAPPIVLDANVLNRDLMRAARKGERTVLLNAANSGMIRIFCAQHVPDEVREHAERLAKRARVSVGEFLRVWEENYVPLLRRVEVLEGLLAPAEAERITQLDHGPQSLCDPDDVPTATLALHLGAILLSTDRKVLWAVYGPDADLTQHDAWLDLLQLGGEAGALAKMKDEDVTPLDVAGNLVAGGLGWVWREVSPWAVLLLAGAAWYGFRRTSPATRQRLTEAGVELVRESVELSVRLTATDRSLRDAAVPVPAWPELARTLPSQAALTRACLYTLARAGSSDLSASELAQTLPRLGAAQGETTVRATLRREVAFHQPYRGRFQVGCQAT